MVWASGPPPNATLPPIYSPRQENLKRLINFHETYYKPPPSSTRDGEGPKALPGTLSERVITAGGLLHHHSTFRVMCEWSTLDYGSIAVARWLSSPPCASCLDLVSCLSWSRSSLCNSTCCVCWDPMNIDTMSSWIVDLLYLCYLYVVYDLACSPLQVDILAE
jgi:hypothetical protein